ncbi:MAG: endo-1,4-beta-xylanase [Treponema sp.]|jgi:GH35 family endo-1,4-beta-xylanase|nr:endo-1,4-beta-xylanase [Treponema sp.]
MNAERYNHRKASIRLHLASAGSGGPAGGPAGGSPAGGPAAGGKPLAQNTPVQISQTRHQFLFGCGMFDAVECAGGGAGGGAGDSPEGSGQEAAQGAPQGGERRVFLQDRLDKALALHNYGTLPFYWGRYEREEGKPDEARLRAAAQWLTERGVLVKGHPLCWHTVCAPWLLKYDTAEILRRQLERIRRDVGAFKGAGGAPGLIDRWDVINEAVIMPVFDKYDNAVTRVCKELGRSGIIREVFAAAREANPGATLLLNDFNTSAGYERLIEDCLGEGIPIDAIGIQSHQHQGYWGLEKLNDVLERFARFGLPLHFTENTIISGELMPAHIEDLNDWQVPRWPSTPEGEERQAREVAEFYETLFAHPAVEAVTTWDLSDGQWLGAPSGLLRRDNSLKPVYHELLKRIKGEWWTGLTTLYTDAEGAVNLNGFRGRYQVRAGDWSADFTLDGKQPAARLRLN